jgi:hypothetical protein
MVSAKEGFGGWIQAYSRLIICSLSKPLSDFMTLIIRYHLYALTRYLSLNNLDGNNFSKFSVSQRIIKLVCFAQHNKRVNIFKFFIFFIFQDCSALFLPTVVSHTIGFNIDFFLYLYLFVLTFLPLYR